MTAQAYKRLVTPMERYLARTPYAIVAVVAREGDILNADTLARIRSHRVLAQHVKALEAAHEKGIRIRVVVDSQHYFLVTDDGIREAAKLIDMVTRGTYTLKITDPILFIKAWVPATYLEPGKVFGPSCPAWPGAGGPSFAV